MTFPIIEAISDFNERLLESTWRMNRKSSRGIRIEIETAIKDLAKILSADHLFLCTKPHLGDKWETLLDHPASDASEPIGEHFPWKLSCIEKTISPPW
jgi:hypothetical protein